MKIRQIYHKKLNFIERFMGSRMGKYKLAVSLILNKKLPPYATKG